MIIIKNERLLYITTILTLSIATPAKSYATEAAYILDENPPANSADEIKGPLSSSFRKERLKGPFFPILKEKLKKLPPFIRDTKLGVNIRTFDLHRDNDGFVDSDGSNDNGAWAVGGEIEYQSGALFDRLSIGASYYTSQKINGAQNEGPTLLLEPVHNGFDVLGQSYINFKLNEEINFRAFRQSFNLPYLNRQDNRMVPNTHEAYVVTGLNAIPNVDFITGYVNKMKSRGSDSFIHISSRAGATGTNDGLYMVGGRYRLNENSNFGAINYYSFNVMNIFYAEANHIINSRKEIPINLAAQFTNQQSIGDENIGNFNTNTGGIKASISYKGTVLSVAGTITDKDSRIRSPFGGRPSYISLMFEDFDRADENAWLVGLSYDFSFIGLNGLTAYTNYAEGYTPDSGNAASLDQSEFNITFDYQPKISFLEGFKLRYRYAQLNQDGTGAIDKTENRIILKWEIPLL
jgi:hypothetical protein